MLVKKAFFSFQDISALNVPVFRDGLVVDQHLKVDEDAVSVLKTASKKSAEMAADGDATYFDLEAEIKSHPDSLFVKCFAIKSDEMNDNGDYFSQDELKKAVGTFVGVPIFVNHNNTDVEQARGKVVHSWWNDEKNGISIIARIDSESYPQLAVGIKKQYIMGTSMGCQVKYSLCSICHNKAETPDQYCSHIKERKTRQYASKNEKCQYHKYGDEEKCPICKAEKGDSKKFAVDQRVFEYNYGIKFIENSFVVNPACHDCGVTEIIDPKVFLSKVADIARRLPGLLKAASESPAMCSDTSCVKLAGQQEIGQLNQALDLLVTVSQSMLKQKDQIDLEFASDLIKVLADLQTVTDELTQQGYGRLQSPGGSEGQSQQTPAAPQSPGGPVTHSVNPTPGGGSKIQEGPAGEAGTVVSPATASKNRINLEKFGMSVKNANVLQLTANIINMKKSLENIRIIRKSKNHLSLGFKI